MGHNERAHGAGYITAEALQYACGEGIVKGAMKAGVKVVTKGVRVAEGMGEGTKAIKSAQQVGEEIKVATEALGSIDGVVAKSEITALRKVGTFLESVNDVMAKPSLLQGQSYEYVRNILGNSQNWVNDVMYKSNRAKGWVLREMNQAGTDFTGRMIQYHPGTPRHFGGAPYWKISSGSGKFRIPLNP